MDMANRAVIVTGGASGIGRATALLLARNGARVFVGDIDNARGQAVAAEAAKQESAGRLPGNGPHQSRIDRRVRRRGAPQVKRVDVLVNAAGWDSTGPFMDNDPDIWDRLVAINLLGAVRLSRAVLPPMIAAGAGKNRQHRLRRRSRRQRRERRSMPPRKAG